MTRIRFEDLPSTNTPRNAENLNKLNNVVISPTEPTTGEEVWIDDLNKKIYTKNDNGDYEEFLKAEDTGWISLELKADCSRTLNARKKNGIVSVMGTVEIKNIVWNKEVAFLPNGFAPNQEIDIVCRGLDGDSDAHILIIDNTGRIGYLNGVNKNTIGQSAVVNIFATFVQG